MQLVPVPTPSEQHPKLQPGLRLYLHLQLLWSLAQTGQELRGQEPKVSHVQPSPKGSSTEDTSVLQWQTFLADPKANGHHCHCSWAVPKGPHPQLCISSYQSSPSASTPKPSSAKTIHTSFNSLTAGLLTLDLYDWTGCSDTSSSAGSPHGMRHPHWSPTPKRETEPGT